jgi:hypothetical protein
MTQSRSGEGYSLVADVPIDAVRSTASGFVLDGRGGDGDEYRLELHFDFPVDARTRKVLGELMSQAEVRVARRARTSLGG